MNQKEPLGRDDPQNIRARAFAYAIRSVRLFRYLQDHRDGAGWILARQYLRSATSIGANIEEAQSGETRADFVHKLGIAQKEARESFYWLRLMAESNLVPKAKLTPLMKETEELIAVVTSIIVSTKKRQRT
ncbi:MAG: four helix bundle protein [Terriglobia bacterium]